jgi:hypothetical protein
LEQAGDDTTVAAVIAGAAEDGGGAGFIEFADIAGDGQTGIFHEGLRRYAGGNRRIIGGLGLGGGEEGGLIQHTGL